jgi:hypothetical protein
MNRHQVLKILLLLHCYSSARLPSSRLHLLSKGLSVGKPLLQQQKKKAGVDKVQLEVWFEIYIFKIHLIYSFMFRTMVQVFVILSHMTMMFLKY